MVHLIVSTTFFVQVIIEIQFLISNFREKIFLYICVCGILLSVITFVYVRYDDDEKIRSVKKAGVKSLGANYTSPYGAVQCRTGRKYSSYLSCAVRCRAAHLKKTSFHGLGSGREGNLGEPGSVLAARPVQVPATHQITYPPHYPEI
uniref:Uncharacterized protein n=1 Tax=Romanomermis culicivorax TaxID=13658 RepID=A0A915HIR5_ROMCU